VKLRLKSLPLAKQERFFAALPVWRRRAVYFFCAFHLAAISWWLIPSKDYGTDVRIAKAFNWLAKGEEALIGWKARMSARRPFWVGWLENYCLVTSTYQSWRMFAPNPTNAHSWMAVYPIEGWRELRSPEVLPPGTPWPERRLPIYAAAPIYKTYETPELAERLRGSPLVYGYGFKIAESVFNRQGTDVLRSISDFGNREYREKTGKVPLGVHVLKLSAPISANLREPRENRFSMRSTVVFFHHY